MTPAQFDALVAETYKKLQELIRVKGGEYAGDAERFENFIRNGKRLDLHRLVIWGVYFNKHIDAINSYVATLQKGQIRESSEPIEGRFEDAIVYLLLGLGMVKEETNTVIKTPSTFPEAGWYYAERDGDSYHPWPFSYIPHIIPDLGIPCDYLGFDNRNIFVTGRDRYALLNSIGAVRSFQMCAIVNVEKTGIATIYYWRDGRFSSAPANKS